MGWWGLPLFLIWVTGQSAFAFELVKREKRLIFSNPFCSNTREVLRSLERWNMSERLNRRCDIQPVRNRQGCEIDVTDCVPESLVETLGLRPTAFGPNCWNSALVFRRILPALRYSDLTEMQLYMNSPLCRQLDNGEPRMPGDVGAIRIVANQQTIETHGFIYISEELAYSKAGMNRAAPYKLEPLDHVLKSYNVPERVECRRNSIDYGLPSCLYQTSYYRCQSLREYLQSAKGVSPLLLRTLMQFTAFENHLQARVLYGIPLPAPARINIVEASKVALELAALFRQRLKTESKFEESTLFLLKVLQKRLDGIVQQLSVTGDGDLAAALAEFEDRLWLQLEFEFAS